MNTTGGLRTGVFEGNLELDTQGTNMRQSGFCAITSPVCSSELVFARMRCQVCIHTSVICASARFGRVCSVALQSSHGVFFFFCVCCPTQQLKNVYPSQHGGVFISNVKFEDGAKDELFQCFMLPGSTKGVVQNCAVVMRLKCVVYCMQRHNDNHGESNSPNQFRPTLYQSGNRSKSMSMVGNNYRFAT